MRVVGGEDAVGRTCIERLAEERSELTRRLKARSLVVRERQRARIVLRAVGGLTQQAIAKELGALRVTVDYRCRRSITQRLWAAHEIKPHLTRTIKLSNDPQFAYKSWDVIGLYLAPPDKAIVLCCDEKSQCQALERTQPGLPVGIGPIKTANDDAVARAPLRCLPP